MKGAAIATAVLFVVNTSANAAPMTLVWPRTADGNRTKPAAASKLAALTDT